MRVHLQECHQVDVSCLLIVSICQGTQHLKVQTVLSPRILTVVGLGHPQDALLDALLLSTRCNLGDLGKVPVESLLGGEAGRGVRDGCKAKQCLSLKMLALK